MIFVGMSFEFIAAGLEGQDGMCGSVYSLTSLDIFSRSANSD